MIVQQVLPPYRMECRRCGEVWIPKPVARGKTAGEYSDGSLDKSAQAHWKVCGGKPTGSG